MPKEDYGELWDYLSQAQKDLLIEGEFLKNDVIKDVKYVFKDYSFLVFPFAKAFEGFLKQIFKDVGYLSRLDYISDHLRLGKLLSPNLIGKLGDRSLYKQLEKTEGREFAERIWLTWKEGRNQVFHYFPHNYKALTFEEAEDIINDMNAVMKETYLKLQIPKLKESKQA